MNNKASNLISDRLKSRLQDAMPAKRTEPTEQEVNDLYAERITPETDLPPMQPLFSMFDVPCFYRGELVADCGKAKSGKTFFLSILMSACLTQKALALKRWKTNEDTPDNDADGTGCKPLKVLWLDTEQSQQSTQEILKERIIPLAEQDLAEMAETQTSTTSPPPFYINNQLYAFNLRGLGFKKRSKMVEVALHTIKPDICIIDGVKDLMTDINDAVQATLVMEKLMELAKKRNCCIVCVLHLNKSEQDRNMRGSIGTELTNKAFEVFQCEALDDSGTFKVAHTFSRKQKMKQKLYYRINEQGQPVECTDYHERPRDEYGRWTSTKSDEEKLSETEIRDLFTTAMEGRTQRPYRELMAVAMKKCVVADAQSYYAYFNQAVALGIIRKMEHPENGEAWVELVDNSLPF